MLSEIYSAIWRLIQSLLNIFSHNNTIEMNPGGIKIIVRFGASQTPVPLILDPSWSVKEMKDALAPKLNLQPSEIKIIFAGKELSNQIRVEDCDIGQQSILHAVKNNRSADYTVQAEVVSPIETIHKLQLTEEEHRQYDSIETKQKKVHFYVYCNKDCKGVTPGKLRVRCRTCKLGTLTVLEDPCGWEDVLTPGKIKGVCQQEICNGDTAEFYFKCANDHLVPDSEDHCVALYLIKTNIFDVPCLACTDVSSTVLVFPCADAHVMCVDCFKTYCMSKLNERQFVEDVEFGYTLPCAVGCENSLLKETHHFRILGDEQYDRYQRFGAEEFVLQSGGVLCPQPGCGAGLLPDPDCNRVVCVANSGCGYVFCKNCLQGYHLGDCVETTCGNPTENAEFRVNFHQADRSRWEDPSKITIRVITKPCPKCRTPTERDGGCMHMVCTRQQCGYEWCWVCQTEWTRDCMASHWF